MAATWKAEEIEYLKDAWGNTSITYISKKLNRSINSIMVKKVKLGLGAFLEGGDYITLNQLCIALSKGSGSYINKSWIENRGFPIKYKKVLNNEFKIVYINDFWDWASKNRTFINWAKVEENILGEEPEWVKEQRRISIKTQIKVKTSPWTKIEDDYLLKLLRQFKYSYMEISQKLNRTEGAIQRRITDLGLKERPIKANNTILWTQQELNLLSEMIKKRYTYELMSMELGKSSKSIRGLIYRVYLTENIDKAAGMLGSGKWGDGRPERSISHRLLSAEEKVQVKSDLTSLASVLKFVIKKEYEGNDYWQKDLCMNWDGICTAGESNCDCCTSFIRIKPQYCRRCGNVFLKRKEAPICDPCAKARIKQYQKKWNVLNKKSCIKSAI